LSNTISNFALDGFFDFCAPAHARKKHAARAAPVIRTNSFNSPLAMIDRSPLGLPYIRITVVPRPTNSSFKRFAISSRNQLGQAGLCTLELYSRENYLVSKQVGPVTAAPSVDTLAH
jgi:hypothetical protein